MGTNDAAAPLLRMPTNGVPLGCASAGNAPDAVVAPRAPRNCRRRMSRINRSPSPPEDPAQFSCGITLPLGNGNLIAARKFLIIAAERREKRIDAELRPFTLLGHPFPLVILEADDAAR